MRVKETQPDLLSEVIYYLYKHFRYIYTPIVNIFNDLDSQAIT